MKQKLKRILVKSRRLYQRFSAIKNVYIKTVLTIIAIFLGYISYKCSVGFETYEQNDVGVYGKVDVDRVNDVVNIDGEVNVREVQSTVSVAGFVRSW